MAVGVAHGNTGRQRRSVDPIRPGDRQLQQFEPRRWRHPGAPSLGDDDFSVAQRGRHARMVVLVNEDADLDSALDSGAIHSTWEAAKPPRNSTFTTSPCAFEG